jgi:hypothetical protein
MINCGVGGAGGQCETLPILGSGGVTGSGGAGAGVGGARARDAGVGDAAVGGADAGDAGAGGAGASDAGTGGAPAGQTLSFASAKSYPAGGPPARVALADMNGDGHPDIVVMTEANPAAALPWQLNVLLNIGDGTFAAPASYPASAFAPYLAVADLNGDGKPDVAITNASSDGNSFSVDVFLNQGGGTLANPIHTRILGLPQALALADIDGDGLNDLIAAFTEYPSDAGVVVLLNLGGGAFAAPRAFSVGTYPSGIVAGDLNHDGRIDLAVSNDDSEIAAGTGNLSVLLNQGGGSFAPAVAYSAGDYLAAVAEADLNGDGQPDLAVLDSSSKIAVLFNRGTGSFVGPLSYGAQHPTGEFALGDVSGDGRIDIVYATPLEYGSSGWVYGDVSVMVNLGDAIFDQPRDFADEPIDGAIALGDLNGDGKLDVVAVNHTYNCNDSVSVLLNTSP